MNRPAPFEQSIVPNFVVFFFKNQIWIQFSRKKGRNNWLLQTRSYSQSPLFQNAAALLVALNLIVANKYTDPVSIAFFLPLSLLNWSITRSKHVINTFKINCLLFFFKKWWSSWCIDTAAPDWRLRIEFWRKCLFCLPVQRLFWMPVALYFSIVQFDEKSVQ